MQFLVTWLYVVLLIAFLFSCVVLYKLISTFGLILEFEFSGSLKAANLACSATLTHCVVRGSDNICGTGHRRAVEY